MSNEEQIPDSVIPQVVQMIRDGKTAREIAEACGITEWAAQGAGSL